ncbi:MAG TPA: T9SS type A sorting domain-containing protein, partial [Bacteroidia bacterium]|nr:T9SS type A sorting domain-containing protein [Bacteroidia bacterium]
NNLNFHLDSYCYSTLALCNVKLIGEDASEIASGVFNLYPNPSNGEFTLQYSGTTGNVVDITIVNTMGQVVYQRKVYEFNGVMEQSFDLGSLGSGIYTLQIHNGNELNNKQFVVTH